ncbi:MAG: anhydro-N-acetylmuramic acid kinase [Deltaproteobacteria bacterium]|nr:anhydro-N-acetylmuramic acid kinase [Deltaproteobacteria bacterium]
MTDRKTITDLSAQIRLRVAGLMSGTSADGVDVAIVDIDSQSQKLVSFGTVRYPPSLRKAVFALFEPTASGVEDICHYNFVLGDFFAKSLMRICRKTAIPLASINLIGSHGQTIHHNSRGRQYAGRRLRSTLQIGEPSLIASQTGITTVADFRPRDIACGGQGAPLVPFADSILFGHSSLNRAVQNIGGISNVTYLPAKNRPEKIVGFDTGPGNMIIDGLVSFITNGQKKYDRNGHLAAKGQVCRPLLNALLEHRYFRKRPPKTCGREEFGLGFCQTLFKKATKDNISKVDLIATTTAFTATTIANAYRRFLPSMPDEIILCGGGARNRTLVRMIGAELKGIKILTTDAFGIDADAKEAMSFAILAWATLKGIDNNVPGATGAKQTAVLGKIIPA